MSDPRQYAEINRSLLVLIPKVEQPVSIKMAIILLLFVLDTGLVLSALSVFSAGPNTGLVLGLAPKFLGISSSCCWSFPKGSKVQPTPQSGFVVRRVRPGFRVRIAGKT
uniref:Orf108c n=1 Tax=Mutarda arvensis TaxID=2982281 RepID=A0A1D6WKL8_MUTAR|nr:orf108c [Sinapis arvensis]AJR33093.1 orf108c [Sinapis arvensis]